LQAAPEADQHDAVRPCLAPDVGRAIVHYHDHLVHSEKILDDLEKKVSNSDHKVDCQDKSVPIDRPTTGEPSKACKHHHFHREPSLDVVVLVSFGISYSD